VASLVWTPCSPLAEEAEEAEEAAAAAAAAAAAVQPPVRRRAAMSRRQVRLRIAPSAARAAS